MPQGVQLAQIEQIFEILDRLAISREAVVIPLRPRRRQRQTFEQRQTGNHRARGGPFRAVV
jgi:hypothetical protein